MKKNSLLPLFCLFCFSAFAASKKVPTFEPLEFDVPQKSCEQFAVVSDPRTEVIGIIARLAGINGFTQSYNGEGSYSESYDMMFKKYKEHKAVKTMQSLNKKKINAADFITLSYFIKPDFSGFITELDPRPEQLNKHWGKIKTKDIYSFLEQIYDFIKVSNYQRIFSVKRSDYLAEVGYVYEDLYKTNLAPWCQSFFNVDTHTKLIVNNTPICAGYSFNDKVVTPEGDKILYLTGFPGMYNSWWIYYFILQYTLEFADTIYPDVKENFDNFFIEYQKNFIEEKEYDKWLKELELDSLYLGFNMNKFFYLEFLRSPEYLEFAKNEEYPLLYEGAYSEYEKEVSNQSFYDAVELTTKYVNNRDKYPSLDSLKSEFITLINNLSIPEE